MSFSSKCRETADACRFCWMCRHICPIGNTTGQERNTARARALSLSLVGRGAAELKGDLVQNVYECALCRACTEDCKTGWDPVIFTREARREAVLAGEEPEAVRLLLETYGKTGHIYGAEPKNKAFSDAARRHAAKTDTLLYLGSDVRHFAKDKALGAIALLERAKVSFTVLEKEPESGRQLSFLCGDTKETRDAMQAAAELYSGYKTVVFYDPEDARTAKQDAPELGITAKAKLVTFPAYLETLIGKKLKVKKSENVYTFQDPAALARALEDVSSARAVLAACGELKEMLLAGKETVLAGDLILDRYLHEVVLGMARRRWDEAVNMGARTLVTADTAEYLALSATKPKGVRVITLEEAVAECL